MKVAEKIPLTKIALKRSALTEVPSALSQKINLMYEVTLRLLHEIQSLNISEHLEIEKGIDLAEEVKKFEIKLIQQALIIAGGNQKVAADLLKTNPSTLSYKIIHYGISNGRLH